MSASLVGSEMCIRDSLPSAWPPQSLQNGASSRARPSSGVRPMGWSTPPVSYTHLTLPTICSV
eukprot:14817277-Alexandrium_andersonii.AAC.1